LRLNLLVSKKRVLPIAVKHLFLYSSILLTLGNLRCDAIIIALHNEDNSPFLSGWTSTGGLNNQGTRSEKIAGVGTWTLGDYGTESGSTRGYEIVPTSQEFNLADTYGWQYTTRIMVTEKSDQLDASIYTRFADGNRRWGLSFGSNSIGDPVVEPTVADAISLNGKLRTFNDYVVRKTAGNGQPEFLVNDEVFLAKFTGQSSTLKRFVWGSYSSADEGEGSYQRVMFEIFPPLDDYFIEHYPLDGNATDALSSNTNTSTGVSTTADRNGNNSGALLFDSEDDRVALDNSSFEPNRRLTLMAWIRPDDAILFQKR
jgi:hypothetical protein